MPENGGAYSGVGVVGCGLVVSVITLVFSLYECALGDGGLVSQAMRNAERVRRGVLAWGLGGVEKLRTNTVVPLELVQVRLYHRGIWV